MKDKKTWPKKACKQCKQMFLPYTSNQSHCQDPCTARTKKSIEEINAGWLQRDEDYRKRMCKNSRNNFIHSKLRVV